MAPTTPPHPGLNAAQLKWLLSPIHASRVGRDGKGFSHVEAWDIRRHLIRCFGFGGYSTDLLAVQLVHERETPGTGNRSRWTVVYRCAVRLTVKVSGMELGRWHGVACGDAINQPSAADAHDLALKTADSQALKRAAVNCGDQFGLSLYNGGTLDPVVLGTLAYATGAEPPASDPPVQPDPEEQQPRADTAQCAPEDRPTPQQDPPTAPRPPEPPAPADPEREKARDEMMRVAHSVNFRDQIGKQFETHFGHPISQGTTQEFREARDLMTGAQ